MLSKKMARLYQQKWVDRRLQYGVVAALKQLIQVPFRKMRRCDDLVVLAVFEKVPIREEMFPDVEELTGAMLEDSNLVADVSSRMLKTLFGFLEAGLRGFAIRRDGKLAGYSFVQPEKSHEFRFGHAFRIPEKTELLKNLFVFSEFRGLSLGKQLNAARVDSVGGELTPIVFVIRANKVAIRNLKIFGFEEAVRVKRTLWFGRMFSQSITVLSEREESVRISEGFAKG